MEGILWRISRPLHYEQPLPGKGMHGLLHVGNFIQLQNPRAIAPYCSPRIETKNESNLENLKSFEHCKTSKKINI